MVMSPAMRGGGLPVGRCRGGGVTTTAWRSRASAAVVGEGGSDSWRVGRGRHTMELLIGETDARQEEEEG